MRSNNNPYRTPAKEMRAETKRNLLLSRFGFANKCGSVAGFVAFFLYMIVMYIRLGSSGGDSYSLVPIVAAIVGSISWLISLPLYSLAIARSHQLLAFHVTAAVLSVTYLIMIGALATNPPILNPTIPVTIISLLMIPFSTGLISAIQTLRSNRDFATPASPK